MIRQHWKGAPSARLCASVAASVWVLGVGWLAPNASAQQQAPPAGTQLGTLVVTPLEPDAPAGTHRHTKIERSALNLELHPAPPDRSATPHPKRTLRTPAGALHIVPPAYPRAALSRGLRGSVTVAFTIERSGHTGNIHIVSATPPVVFDQATREAVRQWLFRPATENGRPVATTATETLIFNPPLRKKAAPEPPPKPAPAIPRPTTPKPPPADRVPTDVHPLHIVAPKYPTRAWRGGIGGSVTVQFTVGTDGKPRHIRVLKAEPNGIFNDAARRAVRQWRFRPVKVPVRVVQTIRFTPPGS